MHHRRRRDGRRIIMMGAVLVLFVAVVVFAVLVGKELFSGGSAPIETPDNGGEIITPAKKFETAEITVTTAYLHEGDLILINEDNPYVFPESSPELVAIVNNRASHGTSASGNPIYSYYTQNGIDKCAKMEKSTLVIFQEWTDAFYAATGNSDLFVFDEDGYRSFDAQEAKHSAKPLEYDAPGTTEHHTGKVVDLYVYTGKVTGKIDDEGFSHVFGWIYENAYKYGFVHRYPADKAAVTGVEYEPYHFRYVGYPHAYYMYKNNLCLEEYLTALKGTTYEAPLEFKADDGVKYMVYYFPVDAAETTKLTVPAEYTYTISGDNMGGFIVTVKVGK